MILTVTLNPSVDINYKIDDFQIDGTNRTGDISKTFGGKGLNVARVVKQLDARVGASGFLGGHLGQFIRDEIDKSEIQDYFIEIEGCTRNCIAVIHDGRQTEILESGPVIQEKEQQQFMNTLSELMENTKIITISGSLPKGLDDRFYSRILEMAEQLNVKVLLDTGGRLLDTTLSCDFKPFFIKPNREEFGELIGLEEINEMQVLETLKMDQMASISLIVVTLGDQGAYVKYNNVIYKAEVPKVHAINPVGSGDSVVAGFAVGLSRNMHDSKLIKFGLSMGILNAMESETGSIDTNNIEWCMKKITLEKL